MDKVDKVEKVEEATGTVRDFDPISGSIPATKVEITVSCRWARFLVHLLRERKTTKNTTVFATENIKCGSPHFISSFRDTFNTA